MLSKHSPVLTLSSALVLCMMVVDEAFGQFAPIERISPIATGVTDSAPIDIDGDGDLDVVSVSRFDGKLLWFDNDGTGHFPDYHLIMELPPDERRLAVVDLNGDGLQDMLIGGGQYGSTPNMVLINQGGQSFNVIELETPSVPSVPTVPYIPHPHALDMDNDGLLDVMIVRHGYWYRNLGGGQFSDRIQIPIGDTNLPLVADINNDSLPDVFIVTSYNFTCLVNSGDGINFMPQPINTSGNKLLGVVDMDNDGDLDLVFRAGLPQLMSTVVWVENIGNGQFGTEYSTGLLLPSSWGLFIADVIGNGIYSLLSLNKPLTVYPLTGINTTPDTLFMFGGAGENTHFADFNGDGVLDLLSDRTLIVVFGNGTLSGWDEAVYLNNPLKCRDFELVDVNRDGLEDIVASCDHWDSRTIEVLRYEGNGQYATRSDMVSYKLYVPEGIQVHDFNSDGTPDVLFHDWYGSLVNLFENDGFGSFGVPETLLMDSADMVFEVAIGDFNGDGLTDLMQIPVQSYGDGIVLHSNTGTSFTPQVVANTQIALAEHVEVFDLEADGDLDVVLALRGSSLNSMPSGLRLLVNDGSGAFTSAFFPDEQDWYNHHLSVVDFNQDGRIDFLVTYGHGNTMMVAVFEFADGEFTKHLIDGTGVHIPHVSHAMDVDNDGLVDIVCFTRTVSDDGTTGLFWYRNMGNMQFDAPFFQSYSQPIITSSPGIVVYHPYQMKSIDRDGDGDHDIFMSDQGNGTLGGSIYYLENLFWGSYRVTGNLFVDVDTSGSITNGDLPFPFIAVTISPSESAFYSNAEGVYNAILGMDTYTVTPGFDSGIWELTTAGSYSVAPDADNPVFTGADFGVVPIGYQPGANLETIELAGACNTQGLMWVSVQNTGNTILSGVVEVVLDPLIDPTAIMSATDSVVGNHLYFSVDSLYYYELRQWPIVVGMPNEQFIGNQMLNHARFYESSGMLLVDSATSVLTCAYDPNDKYETTGEGDMHLIDDGQWLEYTVRFQNTGNAPATDVVLRDPISSLLDRTTFSPVSWSHHVEISLEPNGDAVFRFNDIMLPDSSADFAGSQGYVRYRIRAKTGLNPGTIIPNTARIYFDFNPPIITNTTENMVRCYDMGDQQISTDSTRLYSPFINPISQQWFRNGVAIPQATQSYIIPVLNGSYHVEAVFPVDCKVTSSQLYLESVGIVVDDPIVGLIFPNPSSGDFTVRLSRRPHTSTFLIITDAMGRTIARVDVQERVSIPVSVQGISPGLLVVLMESQGRRELIGKVVLQGH